MGWWKTPKSPSPSPITSPSSPSRRKDLGFFWSPRKKNVHIGDSSSTPVSRSPSSLNEGPVRSASSPLPLPPPEVVRGCPLPSPREAGVGSRLALPNIRKTSEQFDPPAVASNSGYNKNFFQYSNTIEDDIRLNIPTRSAPSSALSSPMLSPRRTSTGDYLSSGYFTPQVHHASSALELPSPDLVIGVHHQGSGNKFIASPDRSPLLSPTARSPGVRSKTLSAPSSPLHPSMFTESPAVWHDNHGNINVHPLPLPPGAPAQSPSTFTHPSVAKAETPSMARQWQKGKLIGSGTFGSVYIATNKHTGALCAMKEVSLIPDDPKSAECIKQLEQEIRFLSKLEHPNIVQYYGSEIIDDRFYIYLEYVYPGSINKYVRDHCGAVTESVVRNFTRHILMGLAYLHSKDAIHRDIKGANLLVNSSGTVKLADFGMAKHLTEAKDAYSMKGTPYWMAPEVLQASMNKDMGYNSAVDIWSVGCTVIEMFTGEHPWNGLPSAAAMFKVLHGSPDIPETLSSEGKDFLRLCFRRNPAERPSANVLLEHPFIANSRQSKFHGHVQASTGINHSDGSQSPNNQYKLKNDLTMKGKPTQNGENVLDNADPTANRHSPRSTLETVPNFSPPRPTQGTSFNHAIFPNSYNGTGKHYTYPESHGMEASYRA